MSKANVISVDLCCEECKKKAVQIVWGVKGVENVFVDMKAQTITVIGDADPYCIVCNLRKHKRFRCAHVITSTVNDAKAISQLKEASEKDAKAASDAKTKAQAAAEASSKAAEAASKAQQEAKAAADATSKAKQNAEAAAEAAEKAKAAAEAAEKAKARACKPHCYGYCSPITCNAPCCGDCHQTECESRGHCSPITCSASCCGDCQQRECQSKNCPVLYVVGDDNPKDWLRLFGI